MFQNYLRIAWRHLGKNRGYTAINIAGLSIGMGIALVIGLWITDEATFDHYAPNHSRLAAGMVNMHLNNAVKKGEFFTGGMIMMPLGKTLGTEYKDLFTRVAMTHPNGSRLFNYGDKTVSGKALTAQADLPGMFGYRMLNGNADATKDPSTIIIAQSLATALFGNGDPLGKTVKVDNTLEYRIGGTYADLPKNTTFNGLQAVFPWGNAENSYHRDNSSWQDHCGGLYVELAPGVTAEQATARVRNLITPYEKDVHEEVLIYPLDKAYLYSQFEFNKPAGGRITIVWLFGIIGVFVLLLACINFMNLSTARSEKRAKEVGIRKTIGSLRSQLIAQFLSESVLLAVIALFIALVLAQASLPFFNNLAAKQMSIPWDNPLFIIAMVGFTVFTGLLAGSYPAFYLSAFRPVKVLKGKLQVGKSASLPRQILVVLQFAVSLILIIGTAIVYRQILFTKDRPVGYNREGLFTVDMNTPEIGNHYEALRAELIQKGLAANVAASDMKPTDFEDGNGIDWAGKRPDQNTIGFYNVNITPDYGKTIGWTITRGRDMSRDFPTDSNAAILNEKAVRSIGFKEPIGQIVKLFGKPYTVVGVCADMVTNDPYDTAENAIFVGGRYTGEMIVKVKPGNDLHKTLAAMGSVFKKYNPSSPFIYKFVDKAYAAKFEAEEHIGNLAAVFTGLAIFISCLGLFGLAAFVAEQRTKEIGVRKVLGASMVNLWGLLSKEFLKLTGIAILIAVPFSYYFMSKWLEGYLYHAPLSSWIFVSAGAGIIVITLLTVSYQSLKAALMNPVKSLRSE
ncbi:ABC transporter permease [Puia dinghuensis]|uniref:ABC transporter permease n=1 Tax=Puia dinghuensis TaxID=1792502 RepID=A0A8J2UHF6_9BACT|nr:ABC transporter permease [Puia dinghuensis]GGB18680.1 ABC transporter permease [Puia dinghuensis]